MTRRRQNPFVETGAASSIFSLADEIGAGFVGSDNQLELTPFQRQVFEAQKELEAKEQQERMPDEAGGGRTPNSAHGGGGGRSQKETTRFVTKDGAKSDDVNTEFVDS